MSLTREAPLGDLQSAQNINFLLLLNKKNTVSKYAS